MYKTRKQHRLQKILASLLERDDIPIRDPTEWKRKNSTMVASSSNRQRNTRVSTKIMKQRTQKANPKPEKTAENSEFSWTQNRPDRRSDQATEQIKVDGCFQILQQTTAVQQIDAQRSKIRGIRIRKERLKKTPLQERIELETHACSLGWHSPPVSSGIMLVSGKN